MVGVFVAGDKTNLKHGFFFLWLKEFNGNGKMSRSAVIYLVTDTISKIFYWCVQNDLP
tara:strand:- start:527 stop:700 length:174 start_codon:yes stop_codon:yes gene_type:complete